MSTLLRFFKRHLTPYLHWYVAGSLCLAATNGLSVWIPMELAEGIDALSDGPGGRARLITATWRVAAMGIAIILVRTVSRLLFFTPGRLVEASVRHELFARILAHQPGTVRRWSTGDLVSRLTSDVNMVRILAGFTALGIINAATAFVLTAWQMVSISPLLAGLVMVPLTIGFLVTVLAVGRLRAVMTRLQEETAAISEHALSTYQGVATLQAFDGEPVASRRFSSLGDDWLRTSLVRANLRTAIGPVLALAASFNVYLLIAVGGPMAVRGELSVGQIVAFTTLVWLLAGPLRGMSFILSLFKQAQASLDRIDAVMDLPPDRPEPGNGLPAPGKPPALSVRGLTMRPNGAAEDVLRDVGFDLAPGSTLGIFGATGAGKSTLLRAIARLENPPRGTILIDGVDLLDLNLDDWRRAMTLVPQKAFLFTESVRDNVSLGRSDASAMRDVLSRTTLDVDLDALPDGVDTVVGEAGLTLSGGQRQRAALARGLLRSTPLLMLDDVLSAVDHHTEQRLIDALRSGEGRPTTLIVANRLSAIAHADLIVVLAHGAVVDRGTHHDLCQRPGPYRDTWLKQSDREAPA